jgi:coenzyme F420-0:L-glutamate ligase/coenzyme F420-1:gamma-L-glutamate ligase
LAQLCFTGLTSLPDVADGDDVAALILGALERERVRLASGDVVVIAQKIVSKAAGLILDLAAVTPSARAHELAEKTGKDPRFVEAVLLESLGVVATRPGVLITAHLTGAVLANAGIDRSNVDPELATEPVLLLPRDPDGEAEAIRAKLNTALGVDVAVVINDSWGRAWRMGTIGTAFGVAGMAALHDYRGRTDMFGRVLEASVEAVADEIAGAANIVMGQADERAPVVIVTGFSRLTNEGSSRELIRPAGEDLFR